MNGLSVEVTTETNEIEVIEKERELKIISVSNISDYLKEINSIGYSQKNLWYRGTGKHDYPLKPSIFRHLTAKTKVDFKQVEKNLNETFEMRSLPYSESREWARDEWERLFFMQHYSVPTRLLDWSGSPLVALHFAVTSVKMDKDGNPLSSAAVWILDPNIWNNAVYAGTGFSGGILTPKDSWLKRYSPTDVYTSPVKMAPVAIRGIHNSPRIVAQQGFFTVFGPTPDHMEDFYLEKTESDYIFPVDCLMKIEIQKEFVNQIRKEVFSLGISESTIYPDLQGLAAELKRLAGF